MAGVINKIASKFGYAPIRSVGRAYKAGMHSRFTTGWEAAASQIDRDVKGSIVLSRGRARSLAQNNPYVIGYLQRKVANIVGAEGFNFQWKVKKDGELDNETNNLIEKKFKEWSKKENCTMRGMLSFVLVQQLILKVWKRDGEFIARMIQGPSAGNKFGFALDLLEVDDIDETINRELPNGNIIKMGIELNPWRKPVAFHLRSRKLQSDLSYARTSGESVRVPASEIIYGFDFETPRQTRAVTPLASVMIPLYMGDNWENASLTNANWSAKLLGYYVKKRLDGNESFEGDDDESAAIDEHITHDFEDATIEELPFGYEFQNPNRQYPSDQHGPFLKTLLRKISVGMGLSYNSLANDLEGVNFSSLRNGKEEERDNYKIEQVALREQFLITVVEHWLKWALLAGSIDGFTAADYDSLNFPVIRGRRWGYIDPLKDVNANKIAVKEGFKTRKDVIDEYGGNKEEVDEELENDFPIKQKLNLGDASETPRC